MKSTDDSSEPDWDTQLEVSLTPTGLIHSLFATASSVHTGWSSCVDRSLVVSDLSSMDESTGRDGSLPVSKRSIDSETNMLKDKLSRTKIVLCLRKAVYLRYLGPSHSGLVGFRFGTREASRSNPERTKISGRGAARRSCTCRAGRLPVRAVNPGLDHGQRTSVIARVYCRPAARSR